MTILFECRVVRAWTPSKRVVTIKHDSVSAKQCIYDLRRMGYRVQSVKDIGTYTPIK